MVVALAGACGNYSNEDLEFMNALPAAEDLSAEIPRSMILPANEAELSRLTHEVIAVFNSALDFLTAADVIRTYPPTSRIPNGRIWGPVAMDKNPAWQWRFVVTRDPGAPEMFMYVFEIQRVGDAADAWIPFIDGSFVATGGVRRGMGHFHITTEGLRAALFPVEINPKGELLKDLDVIYSTAAYPISVTMTLVLYPHARDGNFVDTVMFSYHHEAQENGQGAMEFSGTDSATGATLSIESRWLATGRGRADATAQDGTGAGMTRTECWNDSFEETYDHTPWDPLNPEANHGDLLADCPDISTL